MSLDFIIRIYHDARSSEYQIQYFSIYNNNNNNNMYDLSTFLY